ncbi:MAG: hypothetical protein AB8H86_29575 [Polyangiales bacterium]
MIPPPNELVVYSSDSGHLIAGFRPLLMIVFTRAPKIDEIHLIEEVVDLGLSEGINGGILYVVARDDFRAGVEPRLREMLERIMRSASQKNAKNAVVILTRGFGGAVARGVLAGLLLLSSDRTSVRVFKAPAEACEWLADNHGIPRAGLLDAWTSAIGSLLDGRI